MTSCELVNLTPLFPILRMWVLAVPKSWVILIMKVSVKGVACVSCSDEGDDDGKD